MIKAGVGSSKNSDGLAAAREAAIKALSKAEIKKADLVIVFSTFHHRNNYQKILLIITEITGTECISGCSAIGVLSDEGEIEAEPGLVILTIASDSVKFVPFMKSLSVDFGETAAQQLDSEIDKISEPRIVLTFPDPFKFDHNTFFNKIKKSNNNMPIIGASCSEHPSSNTTFQFINNVVNSSCIAGLILDGSFDFELGVTQGCIAACKPLTVTKADQNIISEINHTPAFKLLKQKIPQSLIEDQNEFIRIVSIGICSIDYNESRSNRDYLVRNILGVNSTNGEIGIADSIVEGDQIVFTLRNPDMAREDLKNMLGNMKSNIKDLDKVRFGIYFNCCGRGAHFYGHQDIDTAYISSYFPEVPIIGFFGNSELAPMSGVNHLFTYTGVLTLFSEQ